jgi:hypothetical protein
LIVLFGLAYVVSQLAILVTLDPIRSALLGRLFERRGVTHRFDWILVLPLASGLLDFFENQIQRVSLSAPDFSTIVDPLPLISTAASDLKWLLVLVYLGTTVVLLVRRRLACQGPWTSDARRNPG